jgi:hypothetical protein
MRHPRIIVPVALAFGAGWFTISLASERTLVFWKVAWLFELTGMFIAACLWFAARSISTPDARKRDEIGGLAYALFASSVVWMPIVAVGLFLLGNRFLATKWSAPEWIQGVVLYAIAISLPAVHFTAFVQLLQTSRPSRWIWVALNGVMFLFDILLVGVATNLLQLGLG